MRSAARLSLFALLVSSGACDARGDASTSNGGTLSSADSAAAADSIRAQARRFSDAYVRGDRAALVSIYTDDGVAAPGGRDFVRGHPAIDSLWALPEGRTMIRHASTPVELHVLGDHAYDWGHYEGQGARNGEPLEPFRGKYVIVWRRDADGQWRMAMDMWNSMPNPAAAAP